MKLIFDRNGDDSFEIEVGYYEKLQTIKEKVEAKRGIPASSQTLFFNGGVLASDDDILYNIILEGSRIHIATAEYSITLKMADAARDLTVDFNDTILQLKKKIQETSPLPALSTAQIVIKNQGGEELFDHMTLLQCKIFPKATVTVELLQPPSTSTTKKPPLLNNSGISIFEIYLNLPAWYFPPKAFRYIIVNMRSRETIFHMKKRIQRVVGRIAVDQYVIKGDNGKELSNHMTMLECGLQSGSSVTVEFPPPLE